MTFLQHFLLGQPLEDNAQHSVGVMLDAHGTLGPVAWRTGLDLEAARTDLVEFQANPTTGGSAAANRIRPAGLHYDYVVDSRVAAPWAAAEWTVVPNVKATLAVRGEYVHYAYDNRMIADNTAANGTPCGASGCLYSRPADRTDRFTNVAPRVGVAWRFAEGHSAYVSFAKGYRPPETTELYRLQRQQNIADIGSENVESYEVGVRGTLGRAGATRAWPGTLSYELAAFAMDKRDVILRDSTGFNIDKGRTRHRGVEYQLAWQPWSRLTLTAAGTHAAHTYRFDSNADGGEVIRSGNDIDTAPRNLGTVRLALRPTDATEAELEWLRVGRYSGDAANLHWYPGHELLNLRTGLKFGDGFALRARVMNLTNRAYADRADYAFGNWRYFPGRERTWYVELAYAAPGGPGGSR
jgi:outer membrane receptor protein involved in Fe transport